MARFLRRQVTYQLRPPAVLATPAAPFVANPLAIVLADRATQDYPRRIVDYRLQAPAVIAPAIVFRPVALTLANERAKLNAGRIYVKYRIRPPAIVAPAITFRPVSSSLATSTRQGSRRPVKYRLSPPTVVTTPVSFVARPLDTTWAPQPRQTRQPRYLLRPPATLQPAAQPFLARAIQTRFSTPVQRKVEQRFFTSTLYPPELINPLDITQFFAKKLVRTPRSAFKATSKLRPPVVLGVVVVTPPFRPLQINYTLAVRRARRVPVTGTQLQAPAVVSIPSAGDNPTGGVFDPNYFLLIHP